MAMRKLFFLISLFVSVTCLVAGYAAVGQWNGAIWSLVLALAWLLAWKYPSLLLPHLCLIVSILLGVTGILSGVPSWLMICGAAAALAAWDLLLLISALKNVSAIGKNRLYEVWHFQSLALAVGGGLLVAFLGQMLSFQIPFPILLILTAGVVFLLERVSRIIKKRSPEA